MPQLWTTSSNLAVSIILAFILTFNSVLAFQITGVQAGVDLSGARPARQEINNLATSGPVFDLYVLALQAFQNVNQSDLLSYYQIAGIHGYPHAPWDGVQGTQTLAGYCTHGAASFVTWHRPYMALFEQVLWIHAQEIAQQYPDSNRDNYTAAAQVLRAPYWDWAANPSIPNVASTPMITVNGPTGPSTIQNPLYQYNFQQGAPLVDFQYGPLSWSNVTLRHWDGQGSNISDANAALKANAATINSYVYQMFSNANFSAFATASIPPFLASSIEMIHNGIHSIVGGSSNNSATGHMTDIAISAFDPIFWLHHCNVDRFLAMWEALHPEAWMVPTVNTVGTYTDPPGTLVTGNTSLTPFHSDNGTALYTSDGVRSTRLLGYTYPEINDWNNTAASLAAQVQSAVNALYNPPSTSSKRAYSPQIMAHSQNIAQIFSHISLEDAKRLRVNSLANQWSVRVRIPRAAYTGSFSIDFFMGQVPEDPSSWATASNLIGSVVNLASTRVDSGPANIDPTASVYGGVSLTHIVAAAIERHVIKVQTTEVVTGLLREHLNWSVRSLDGEAIELTQLNGLSISVASQTATPIKRITKLPRYGTLNTHLNVTMNKPCGAK